MINIGTILRGMFRIFTILIFVFSLQAFAGQQQSLQQSTRERAMKAGQQLREYHRQQAESLKKSALRGTSSVQPKVGISVNKTSGLSSTIFFYDNFESGAHAWTTELYGGATDNIWHRTTLNSSSPTHSWWAGIDGQGDYNTGRTINTAVVSEPINLTGAVGSISLMFAENYATEHGWDDCMVDVSTDSEATWTHLRGGYGAAPSGSSEGWTITSLDLTPYSGKTIKIRFYFYTFDANFNDFPGWFIDDIVVFDQRGTIEGRKFFDVNNNGVKDPGERGIKDWLITATGPVTITTTTNYRGHYSLTLPLGSYTVTEAFEPNWTQKYPLVRSLEYQSHHTRYGCRQHPFRELHTVKLHQRYDVQ